MERQKKKSTQPRGRGGNARNSGRKGIYRETEFRPERVMSQWMRVER